MAPLIGLTEMVALALEQMVIIALVMAAPVVVAAAAWADTNG